MRITVASNFDGAEHRWALYIDAAKNVEPALKEFAKYLRKKTSDRFKQQGPGWKPLAESTREKLTATKAGRITRTGKVSASSGRRLAQAVKKQIKAGTATSAAKTAIEKMIKSGLTGNSIAMLAFAASRGAFGTAGGKTVMKIAKELEKGPSKKNALAKHKLLGKLSSSIKTKVSNNSLVVYSIVPWSGVHNDGGSGKNNTIPARTFLKLDDEDVAKLAELLEAHLVPL